MNNFSRLVSEQMVTMEKLLNLQSELDRCRKMEEIFSCIQNEAEVKSIQIEINRVKKELYDVQQLFEKQTEEVIQSYQEMEMSPIR